jgi:methylthioribulose-1-phosphate dehydratase
MTVTDDMRTDRGLAEVARALYGRGWMEGTSGNISVRLAGRESIFVTGSGRAKGELTADDIVEVDLHTCRPAREARLQPSAETPIHAALYRLFPDCGAVVHAHPPFCTAVAARAARMGATAVTFAEFEIIKGLGTPVVAEATVPVFANWARPARIAEDMVARLTCADPPALLISHHGATAWGPTLELARNRLECVEALCQLQLIT